MTVNAQALPYPESSSSQWRSWFAVIALVYLLLAAVGAIGDGFKTATGGNARELFAFATNPIIALIVGVVATSLIQSSSTVTSIIVGMVAGGLPLAIAIPLAMGANIGTSLTSTIVSLGHVRNGTEFRRAFAAATVHDSFNLLAVFLLLPLELLFHPLETICKALASLLVGDANLSMTSVNFMKTALSPANDILTGAVSWLPTVWSGIALVVIGIAAIVFAVTTIGKVLRKVMVGRAKALMHAAVGRGPLSGMLSGGIITVAVQSSSTTTALIVPLAGTGVFTLRQVYPFTLGANIGTTITALLAATAISGPTAVLALQIALIHLSFNILAILIIYGLPWLRPLPIRIAEALATQAQKNRLFVVGYILGVFFVVPLLALGLIELF